MKNKFFNDKYFWGVLFLVFFSILIRFSALNPISLWLDDLWVALIAKVNNFDDFMLVNGPAPIFFTALQFLSSKIIKDKELSMQLIPFIFGTLNISFFYKLVLKILKNKSLSFLAAAILSVNSLMLNYSIRAKQYTLEMFFVIVLLIIFVDIIRKKNNLKNWIRAFFVSIISLGFSFTSILISGFFLNFLAFYNNLKSSWKNIRQFILAVIFDIVLFLYYFLFLKPRASETMIAYWNDDFINLNQDIFGILKDIIDKFCVVILNAFPGFTIGFTQRYIIKSEYYFLLTIILFVSFCGINYLKEKKYFELLYFVLLFYPFLVLLGILKIYPLGGVRTDLFSYPITILLTILGISKFFDLSKKSINWVGFVFIFILVIVFSPKKIIYSDQANASVCIDYLKDKVKDNKVLILPHSTFALSYYSNNPVAFMETTSFGTGYFPVSENINVFTLKPYGDYWKKPELLKKGLDDFGELIQNEDKYYFFATAHPYNVFQYIDTRLKNLGFTEAKIFNKVDCFVLEYNRKGKK